MIKTKKEDMLEEMGELLGSGCTDDLTVRTRRGSTYLIRDRSTEECAAADVYLSRGAYASVCMPLPPMNPNHPYLFVSAADNGYRVVDESDGAGILDLSAYGLTKEDLIDLTRDLLVDKAKRLRPDAFSSLRVDTPRGPIIAKACGEKNSYPGIFVSIPDQPDNAPCDEYGTLIELPYTEAEVELNGKDCRFAYHVWADRYQEDPSVSGQFPKTEMPFD